MGERREIHTDDAPRPAGPYSQALVVDGWVFVSGQVPLDPRTNRLIDGEIEAQTAQVLANLTAVLRAAGSEPERVVRTTVYLSDLALFPRMNQVYAQHFTGDLKPARTTIQAAKLPLGAAVEIDAIATRD